MVIPTNTINSEITTFCRYNFFIPLYNCPVHLNLLPLFTRLFVGICLILGTFYYDSMTFVTDGISKENES